MQKRAINDSFLDENLQDFLRGWDNQYKMGMAEIDLFKEEKTQQWSEEQKKLFVQLLYHQRAHFDDVLWLMGNFAPNAEAKEVILNNIRDELGMNGLSHEKLYLEFARSLGVDLTYELIEEKYYYSFLREYNHGHLRWLRDHDWDHRLAAFTAIERLDNLDYLGLRDVAVSIGAVGKALTFFNVHIHVKHYEAAEKFFIILWKSKSDVVKSVFQFIGSYQLEIWRKISDAVFKGSY